MKRIGFRDKTGILFFCLHFILIGRPSRDVDGLFAHLFPSQDKVLPIDFLVLLAVGIVDVKTIGVVPDDRNAVHDVADVDRDLSAFATLPSVRIGQEGCRRDDPNWIAFVQGCDDRIKILPADILHAIGWDVFGCQSRDGAMIDAKTVVRSGHVADKPFIWVAVQTRFRSRSERLGAYQRARFS